MTLTATVENSADGRARVKIKEHEEPYASRDFSKSEDAADYARLINSGRIAPTLRDSDTSATYDDLDD